MRIISFGSKDYYDLAQGAGTDDLLTYVRKEAQHKLGMYRGSLVSALPPEVAGLSSLVTSMPNPIGISNPGAHGRVEVYPGWILFAGKVYPFAKVFRRPPAEIELKLTDVCYTLESLSNLLKEHNYEIKKKRTIGSFKWSWLEFFNMTGSADWLSVCIEDKLPIVLCDRSSGELIINPLLKPYRFYKVLDSWQAYQELSMFIGNLASPEKAVTDIEDKYRVVQHGFDEWSFRKRPG